MKKYRLVLAGLFSVLFVSTASAYTTPGLMLPSTRQLMTFGEKCGLVVAVVALAVSVIVVIVGYFGFKKSQDTRYRDEEDWVKSIFWMAVGALVGCFALYWVVKLLVLLGGSL